MATIENVVFDEALGKIDNCNKAEVREADETVLVTVTLDGDNFGSPGDKGGGGRQIECLVEDTGDMSDLAVDVTGDATKVVLLVDTTDYLEADLTGSPVSLTTDNMIDLSSFLVGFSDPA